MTKPLSLSIGRIVFSLILSACVVPSITSAATAPVSAVSQDVYSANLSAMKELLLSLSKLISQGVVAPVQAQTLSAAPTITGVGVTVGQGTADIVWMTDSAANSNVRYGFTSGNYTMTAFTSCDAGGLVTNHCVRLSSLPASTQIYYRISSQPYMGEQGQYEGSFTMGGGGSAPVVSVTVDGATGTVNRTAPTTYAVQWSATNSPTSCTGSGTWGMNLPVPSGSWNFNGVSVVGLKTYTVTCTNQYGSGSNTVYVDIQSSSPQACTSYTISTDKSTYTTGETVNWTLNCPGGGPGNFAVTIIKPDSSTMPQLTVTGATAWPQSYGIPTSEFMPGSYMVRACYTEDCQQQPIATAAFTVSAAGSPPPSPSTPSPASYSGGTGVSYTFTTHIYQDPDGNQVKAVFDWGDGTTSDNSSGFLTPSSGGTQVSASHTWSTPGVMYSVKAKAIDSTGLYSAWSSSASMTVGTKPNPPVLATPSVNGTSVTLNWTESSQEVTAFKIYRKMTSPSLSAPQSFSDISPSVYTYTDNGYPGTSGLAAGTYEYYMQAKNLSGGGTYPVYSDQSNSVTATVSNVTQSTTPPPVPTGFAAINLGTSTIAFHWNDTAGATGYSIQRTAGGVTQTVATLGAVTTWTDTGLVAGGYYYKISAQNSAGSSAYITPIFINFAGAGGTSCNGLSLTLNKYSFIVGETVNYTYACTPGGTAPMVMTRLIKPDSSGTTFGPAYNVSSSSSGFSTSNYSPGTYTLQACFSSTCQPVATASASFTVTSSGGGTPSAPTNLSATVSGSGAINLGWQDMATNETEYRVYQRLTGATSWNYLATIAQNSVSYADASSLAAGTYDYMVVSCANSNCAGSNIAAVTVSGGTTTWPPIVVTIPSAGSDIQAGAVITPQWSGGNPAWLVNLLLIKGMSTTNLALSVPNTGSRTVTIPTSTPLGSSYFLRVACQGCTSTTTGWFGDGGTFTVSAAAPAQAPVVSLSIDGATGTISKVIPANYTLSWSATNNPVNCTASGAWSGARTSSQTEPHYADGYAGTRTFTLTCTNSYGSGSASVTLTTTYAASGGTVTAPQAPALAVSLSGNTPVLSWSAVDGVTHYRIYRRASPGGTPAQVGQFANAITRFTDLDLLPAGNSYDYYAVSCDGTACSANSNIVTVIVPTGITLPVSPYLSSPTVGNGAVLLSWTSVANVDSYRIWRNTPSGSGNWIMVGETNAATAQYQDSSVPTGSYNYRVRACRSGFCVSSNISVNIFVPIATQASTTVPALRMFVDGMKNVVKPLGSAYTISWNASGSITSCYAGGAWTGTRSAAGTYSFTAPSVSSTLTYSLSCALSGGSYVSDAVMVQIGSTSGTIVSTSTPPIPVGVTAYATGTTVRIGWNDVSGETYYKVQRQLQGVGSWTDLGIASADTINYQDSYVPQGTQNYKVIACNPYGCSAPSNPVSATISTEQSTSTVPISPIVSFAGYNWNPVYVSLGGDVKGFGNWRSEGGVLGQDRIGDLHYKIVAGSISPFADGDVYAIVRFSSGKEVGLCGRMDSDGNGYCFSTGWGGFDQVAISMMRNRDQNPVIVVPGMMQHISTDTDYVMKLRFEGAKISGKIFPYGEPEPSAWAVTVSNTVYPAGRIGFYTYNSQIKIKALAVGSAATTPAPVLFVTDTTSTITTTATATTPLPVVPFRISGWNYSQNASDTMTISASFGASVDTDSVNAYTAYISRVEEIQDTSKRVAAKIRVNADSVSLETAYPLLSGMEYASVFSGQIRAASGTYMGQDYICRFTAIQGAYQKCPLVSIVAGGQASVVVKQDETAIPGVLEGSVFLPGNVPVENVGVHIFGRKKGLNYNALTDKDGSFSRVVPPDTYAVDVNVPQAADGATIPAIPDTVVKPDGKATLKIQLVKPVKIIGGMVAFSDGQAIRDAEVSAYSFDTKAWRKIMVDEEGRFELQVGGGFWRVGVRPKDSASASWYWSGGLQDVTFTTSTKEERKTANFIIPISDSVLSVTAVDQNDQPLQGAGIAIGLLSSTATSSAASTMPPETRRTDSNGSAQLILRSGTYFVRGNIAPESGYFNPEERMITLSSGEQKDVKLVFAERSELEPLYIQGITSLSDGAKTEAFVYAWSEKGGFIQTRSDAEGAYGLPVNPDSHWHIGARKELDGYGYTSSEFTVKVTTTSVNMDLLLSRGSQTPLSSPVTVSERSDHPVAAETSDGAKITVPENVSGMATGTINIEVRPTVEAPSQAATKVVGTVYDINIKDDDGNLVSSLSKDVEIVLPYTSEDLKDLGIAEDNLMPSYFDESTGAWVKVNNFIIDKKNKKVILRVSHLTRFALVASADTTAPAAPTRVAVKAGNTGLVVSWVNPATDFDHVKVYRSVEGGKLGAILNAEVRDTSIIDATTKPGVRYYYAVRAVDPAGNESTNIAQVSALGIKLSQTKKITSTLKVGSKGGEVMLLQQILAKESFLAANAVTGKFDKNTKEAVIKFQEKYASEILKPAGLTTGNGTVGANTRKKLNVLAAALFAPSAKQATASPKKQ